MKISKVKSTWLRVPIPEEKRHRSDFGVADAFDTVLVEVECDNGLVGYGEAKSSVHSTSDNHALVALIEKELGPQLIGQDARMINKLWDIMYCGSRAGYNLEYGRSFPVMGRRGIHISAISGIDVALWDLLGKSMEVPLWQLLGGKRQDSMPAYASGGWAAKDAIGEQLCGYVKAGGFKAVKMRVGVGDGTVDHSIARVFAAREALGEDIAIMCDAHGTWSVPEAKRFCREVEDCALAWMEEPVSADNRPGLKAIRDATSIPIASGESESTRFAFRDLLMLQAVDILQPDISLVGGITETRKIDALCSSFDVTFMPHIWGGAPSFAAGLHLAAASNASSLLEYSLGANPMLHNLARESFIVSDGRLAIPDMPGLGITIDQDFVEEFCFGK